MTNYNYNKAAIKYLLGNYFTIDTESRIDLDKALSSQLITSVQRQVIASHFALQLNMSKASVLTHIPLGEFIQQTDEALENIEALMNGYKDPGKFPQLILNSPTSIIEYISNVANGAPIFQIAQQVRIDLLSLLVSTDGDELAQEALKQQRYGLPQHIYDELFNSPYVEDVYTTRPTKEYGTAANTPYNQTVEVWDRFIDDENYHNGVIHENDWNGFSHKKRTTELED